MNPFVWLDDKVLSFSDRAVLAVWNRFEIRHSMMLRISIFISLSADLVNRPTWKQGISFAITLAFNMFIIWLCYDLLPAEASNMKTASWRVRIFSRILRNMFWIFCLVAIATAPDRYPGFSGIVDIVGWIAILAYNLLWCALTPTKPPQRRKKEAKVGLAATVRVTT